MDTVPCRCIYAVNVKNEHGKTWRMDNCLVNSRRFWIRWVAFLCNQNLIKDEISRKQNNSV